ncbi:MAG: phospholipid carrier-dependent glycosyltransferase [Gammaproteobacteria bacterium]|nr:phospholipid carrier-dependent glycosyltransferase [Gammaproteobacteria bacterium]
MKTNCSKAIVAVVALIILGGLFLRVYIVNESFVIGPLRSDALEYYSYSQNLKEFGVYSRQSRQLVVDGTELVHDAHRNPGYVAFLLPFTEYPPDYEMLKKVRMTQVLISVLSLFVGIMFFKSFLSWPAALGALLLLTLSPHMASMNNYILSESLFIFFLLLSGLVFSYHIRSESISSAIMLGVIIGLALLVRPTILYFPFLMLILIKKVSLRRKLLVITAFMVGFFSMYGPWMIWKQHSVPESKDPNLMVMTIQKGMYPNLMYKGDSRTFGYPNKIDPQWSKRNTLSAVASEIKRRVSAEPEKYLRWYILGKPAIFFSWNILVGQGDVLVYPVEDSPFFRNRLVFAIHEAMYHLHWPAIILALISSILIWIPGVSRSVSEKTVSPVRFCSLLILYFILVHLVGTPLPRYSIPVYPFIYAMAMFMLTLIYSFALSFNSKGKQEV